MNSPRTILRYALLASAAALVLAVPRPAAAQKIDVRLGLWEMTTVVDINGALPFDTSKLTPEQQAKMAAAMAGMKKNMAQPHVMKSCLTKEKLAQSMLGQNHADACKPTVITDTSTEYAVKFACDGGQGMESGEWHFVALTPTNVKGTGQMTFSQGGQKTTSTSNMTAKWLSDSCGNVK